MAIAQSRLSFAPPPPGYGPFNAVFLQPGPGLTKPLPTDNPLTSGRQSWSLTLWLKTNDATPTTLLAGLGHPSDTDPRFLALREGRPTLWFGSSEISSKAPLTPNVWHALGLSVDASGLAHLYADGSELASTMLPLAPTSPVLELGPTAPISGYQQFSGWLALVTLRNVPLDATDVNGLVTAFPGLDNLHFEAADLNPSSTLLGKAQVQ